MNTRYLSLFAAAALVMALSACSPKSAPAVSAGQSGAGQTASSQADSGGAAQGQTAAPQTQSQGQDTTTKAAQPATPTDPTSRMLLGAGFDVPRQEVASTDFTLSDLAGHQVSLSSYKGKLVILSFWATWCGPCKQEIPSVEALYQKLSSKGFTVVAVDVGEKAEDVASFVKSYKMTFPILLDTDGSVASQYDAGSIPTNYVVSRDGKLLARVVGYDGKEWTSPEKVDLFEKLLKL